MKAPAWLNHLRTDTRGRPVPYINLWGTEDAQRYSIRHDAHVGMPGLYLDDSAETEPDFTHQNMQRQRECMVKGLCQVCGRQIPWPRRYLVLSSMSVEEVTVAGKWTSVVTEPWLDRGCAMLALRVCPALIRRTDAEDLHLVPIPHQRYAQLAVSQGWVDGPLQAESQRIQPAMWVKAILPGITISRRSA